MPAAGKDHGSNIGMGGLRFWKRLSTNDITDIPGKLESDFM